MKCGISGRVGAFILLFALLAWPATVVQAQAPYLVKDINPVVGGPGDSNPSGLVGVGDLLFFRGCDVDHGCELWRSDGTPAGTAPIKDIRPGVASSDPNSLTNVNGTLFFTAEDGTNGLELWKSDGSPGGTVLVRDIKPGVAHSVPGNLTNVNGTLFFTADNGTNGLELWKSDGTPAGTVLVKDIRPGVVSSSLSNLTNLNGTLFFSANDGTNGLELWKSDGTLAGTVLVKDINPGPGSSNLANLTNVNGTLFFSANDGTNGAELWKSDGTLAGTVLVKDIIPGAASSNPVWLTSVNGALLFSGDDGTNGAELWKSDGTPAGTVLVNDINPGAGSSSPGHLTNVDGTLFFSANDGANGVELWKSDGTPGGTVLVKDINSGAASSGPEWLTNLNGTLFFSARDGANGVELWKSDGTPGGTVLIKDINPGAGLSSSPNFLTNVNGTLFFSANDGTNGLEPWKSDGTPAGTGSVRDINPGAASSSPAGLTNVNGTLFFQANDGTNGSGLWKSDGAPGGTVLVKHIAPTSPINVNGTLFFSAFDPTSGFELWKSDGTTAGTILVKDINPGAGSSGPTNLNNVNGTLFFSALDPTNGFELWKSDGTPAGTVLVKDINPGEANGGASKVIEVNGTLYFAANDGTNESELWKSDGTPAGTVLVKDINPGATGSNSRNLTNVNGMLFFSANDGTNGQELWKSDGTPAGTVLVKDIFPGSESFGPINLTNVNGALFFSATDGTNGQELWKSDGTPAGTVLIKDIYPGAESAGPDDLTNVNGTLFFSATDGTNGRELWKSDGTPGGTVLVMNISPGGPLSSSTLSNLTNVNGTLFFSANDGTNGIELWKSDGTPAGTVLVKDLYLGFLSSLPGPFTLTGPRLFFSATDAGAGRELWALDVGADLSVTKTDGQATAVPGQPITYTIVVSNAGPLFVTGATVADAVSAALTGATWTCIGAGGGTCTASGSGSIADTVSLPVGATVTYTLTGTVDPLATGTLSNTATVAAPADVLDPDLGNNAATDLDVIGVPAGAVTAMAQSSSSVLVKWTDPNAGETAFQVERSTNGTTFTPVQTVGGNVTSHLDNSGLAPATLYYYRVIAVTPPGDIPSNVATATTFPAAAAKVCATPVSPYHSWARGIAVARAGTQWVAAWSDRRNGANEEIYVQGLAASGAPTGSATRITTNDMLSRYPTLTWNGTNLGLLWTENMRDAAGGDKADYRFALLSGTGALVRGPLPLFTNGGTAPGLVNDRGQQPLVWDGSGWGVFVAEGTNSPQDLAYYRLDADGDRVLGPIAVTNTAGDWEIDVSAVWNGSEYGVSWIRQHDTTWEVRFQRMQSNGTLLGSPQVLWSAPAGSTVGHTSVIWDGANWVVAWVDNGPSPDFPQAVYLRTLNPDGTPAAVAKRISSAFDPDFPPADQVPVYDDVPVLMAKPGGGYVIFTTSFLNSTGVNEIARLEANASGGPVGTRLVQSTSDSHQSIYARAATDGGQFLLGYHDGASGTQEVATVLVNSAGSVVGGPSAVTSGHSAPESDAFVASPSNPAVASLAGGFAVLWSEPLAGQIYARTYDSTGAQSGTRSPLSASGLAGRIATVGVGSTFAVSWRDATNQVRFARYDATGGPLGSEQVVTSATGGPVNASLDWSGEQYGVAWIEGGSARLQRLLANGSPLGPQATLGGGAQGPGPVLRWVGSGWALVWRSGGNLFFGRISPTGTTAVAPVQLTTSGGVANQFQLHWNGDKLGLAWTEQRAGYPPGQDVYFTVLDASGVKQFPEIVVAGSDWFDTQPSVYWAGTQFAVVHAYGLGWLRETLVSPTGTLGTTRLLANRSGQSGVAGDGATAGIAWPQLGEMYFETTACLADLTPATCPTPSASFDGQKVSLTWTAAADPESGVSQYHAYRDGNLLAEQNGTSLGLDDPGFVPGASHAYSVRPLNGAYLEPASCPAATVFTGTADVSVTKTDGQASAVPGMPVTYTIVATSAGPDPVSGATVTDTLPGTLSGATWTCVASSGASCTASGSGSIADAVTLPAGGAVTYTLTATVSPSATGSLTNTAAIALPPGGNDSNTANDSATDTDTLTPGADLSITKTDGQTTAVPGQGLAYTIVAANAGPSGAVGAVVTDGVPAALTAVAWTCTGAGGGTCTASGSGSIGDSVNLPVGASVTYTLTGTLSPSATGSIANTATVTAPGGVLDTNLANNSATDTDVVSACGVEIVVVPDGRLTRSLIAAGTTAWFGASLRIGNSYSVEFHGSTGGAAPGTLTVYSGDDGCSGTSTLVTTNTADVDPPGTGAAARVSFTATGATGYFHAKLANGSGTGLPFAFSWSDTTMFSPAWSDNGAFDTFYSFQNTTGSSLTGKLTLFDVNGAVLTTLALTIPAGQTVSTNTGAIGIPRNLTGTARLTHNGPPGAVIAEAAIARFSISPAYVQPVKFQAMRETR